jgi:hypothetical protein
MFDNHHGKIKKKSLEKILESLEEDKAIIGKLYGKTKIYFYNQVHHPQLDQEKLDKVKTDMESLRVDNQVKTNRLKELKAEVSRYEKTLSIESLQAEVLELESTVKRIKDKLKKYESKEVELVPEAEIKKIEQERDKLQVEYKKRCKLLKDIIDTVCEGTEQKPEKVRKLMGLD